MYIDLILGGCIEFLLFSHIPANKILIRNKYSYLQATKKRVKHELSLAQTVTTGRLEKAALLRNDESILIHIRGRDCVAIEARYHKRCYHTYTTCLLRERKIIGPTLYDKAFDEFCLEIIEKRIIKNKEVLLLGNLLKRFTSCVQEIEMVDVPCKASRLRKRIQTRYPYLVFQRSKTMNKGTLVYDDSLTAGDVADDMTTIQSDSDTEEDEGDDYDNDGENDHSKLGEDGEHEDKGTTPPMPNCSLQILFTVAMEIRKLLNECKGVDSELPPDSHDLTLALATASIPVKLHNFLAWCLGFSCEPVENETVAISPIERTKVVSIAQDLVYAESKGRKLTHKSLALGMAVRQITGSIRLLRILHGLGHTTSTSTVYKHDTGLALASSKGQEIIIPRNINPGVFATLAWDNNDFNEETVSGKGTTHVANGIILQNGDVRLGDKVTVSKKNRTVKAPETNIIPYTSREKGTISLRSHSSDISLEEQSYRHEQDVPRNSYFVHTLARKYASDQGGNLPGWTGFNTQVYKDVPKVSKIGYLPVIDAPVTDIATVNTILRHSVSICTRLQLPEIVLVFDEALYAKAQQIRWKDEELKNRLVIRLGDFHTIMSFCSAIAKIFKDAGLQVSFQLCFHLFRLVPVYQHACVSVCVCVCVLVCLCLSMCQSVFGSNISNDVILCWYNFRTL